MARACSKNFTLAKVSGTPFSASSMAGASTRARGMLPKRSSAAIQPPRLPGVAQAFGPPASSSSVHFARRRPRAGRGR